jgi:outer membrane receptor protein involved in Fe transport
MRTRLLRRNNLLASVIATTLASTAGMPTIAWAQTAEATLRGRAAANSEVSAHNVDTGATRRTIADADGVYTLPGLPPGTYRVEAGPGTATVVTLTVASTATLDLVAAGEVPAGSLGEIHVSARRLNEVRTSQVGSTVSLQQIDTIPQLTRNFLEFADTVPGMVFSVDSQHNSSLTAGGQNASAVNVYIDGVGQKNYVKEGGVSGQFFTQGNPFPQLAIGEYKVITSNYKAEFDQVSSAAVTAETKSGTNEFHGEVIGTYTSDAYRAETPAEAAANLKTPSKEKEYGFAIGGPIIQDQMHFFLTYERKNYTTPITVTPGVTSINGVSINSLLPASAVSQFGPSSLPFTEDLVYGKIDWELSDFDRFEVSVKYRKEDQIGGIGVAQAASSAIDTKNNDTRVTARWQHSANRWFNDLLFTYEDAYSAPSSQGIGNGSLYAVHSQNDRLVLDTGPSSPLATQNKGQRGPGLQDDLTFSNLRWMGDHTVKTGAKVKLVTLTAQDAENINPQFTYDVEATGTSALPYRAFFTNPVPGQSPTAESRNTQFGLYLQDDWVANEHWTFNLGARWDYEKTPSYLGYITPANVVAALNGPDPNAPGQTYAQTLAKGGINVNDYISNGHDRSAYKGEFQPRLGLSFDLNADQRHVVFGGYGRSYDRDLYDYLQLELTKSALPEYTVYFQPTCTGAPCFAWNPKYLNGLSNLQSLVASSNAGREVDMMNNNLKAPYSDQFSVGMRNTIGEWNTSASVARILSKDGFVFTLGNRFPTGAFWMNGGQPWGNGVPGFGSLIIGNNGIETKTSQLLLSAEKPFTQASRWGVTIAYTYTDAKQNRDITQHYSFDEATIAQYPFITSNAAAKHRLVVAGSLGGPWGLVFGGKLTLASPTPVNDIACYLAPGQHFPTGSNCTPIAATPPNFFGYRSIDLQATENFNVTKDVVVYVRFDALNVFNYANYSDTINNWGSNGVLNSNPVNYNQTGNITGPPRTFRLTVGARF